MDAVLVAETPDEHEAQTARVAERALEQARMATEAAGVTAETGAKSTINPIARSSTAPRRVTAT